MVSDSLLDSALDAWQVAFQDGDDRPAADFCSDHPDLLPELERQVAALRNMLRVVRVASPASDDTRPDPVDAGNTATGERTAADRLMAGVTGPPGFVLERELGRGGMGVVYLARQHGLNRPAALKWIATHRDPQVVVRFLAEAAAAAAVRHPNVVEVYQFGEHDGRPFLVMEYCRGGTLSEMLDASGDRFSDHRIADLMADVADGVNAAHAAGVVHRDLKPDNILLTADGTPKVTDFGLAKFGPGKDLTPSGVAVGTPAYMSPEQASGTGFAGPASDVWSLGIILYELLTGTRPFRGPAPVDYLAQITSGHFPPVRAMRPDVPRDLALITEKCLRHDPAERYQTAGQLAADLRNWLDGRPISARPVGVLEGAWKWTRRNKAAAALIATLAAVAISLPPAIVWNQSRIESAERDAKDAEAAGQAARELVAQRDALLRLANVRRRALDRPPEWTANNRDDLQRIVKYGQYDGTLQDIVRAEVLEVALAYDIRPAGTWKAPHMVLPVVASPDGRLVALGEYRSTIGTPVYISLVDPVTGDVRRKLRFTAAKHLTSQDTWAPIDGVCALAFSPDGKRLYVTARSARVFRYDLDSPQETPTLVWTALKGKLESVCVSPDGKLVHAADNRQVGTWNADTGEPLAVVTRPNRCVWLVSNPNRPELLLYGLNNCVSSVDPKTLQPLPGGRNEEPSGFRGQFVGGGRVLVMPDTMQRLVLHDPAGPVATPTAIVDPKLRGLAHEHTITRIVCHPTLPVVATASDHTISRMIKIWDVSCGRHIATIPMPAGTDMHLAWAGTDGRYLVALTGKDLFRWELKTPAFQTTTTTVPHVLVDASLNADGQVVALERVIDGTTTSPLWLDPISGGAGASVVPITRPQTPAGELFTMVATWSPDGRRLAAGAGLSGIHVFRTGRTPFSLLGRLPLATRCCFTADGQLLWHLGPGKNRDQTVTVRDATTLAELKTWVNTEIGVDEVLTGIDELAAGTNRAVAGGNAGDVAVFDRKLNLLGVAKAGGRDDIYSLAVEPEDSFALAGTQSGKVRAIDLRTPALRQTVLSHGHPNGTLALAISRDGTRIATGGKDHVVRLWRRIPDDTELRFEVLATVPNLPSECKRLEFGATADTLMVHLRHEHAVRVWDLKKMNAELTAHSLGW